MRKVIFGIMILILLVLNPLVVTSEDNMIEKRIAGTEYSISLPSDWVFGDKTVTDNSLICQKLNISAKQFIANLNSNNTLFIAMPSKKNIIYPMLMLTVIDVDDKDFYKYTDSELDSIGLEYANIIKDQGDISDKISKVGKFEGNAIFVSIIVERLLDYQLHYLTVKDGKLFWFMMESTFLDGEETAQKILRSFRFNQNTTKWDSENCSLGKSHYESMGFERYIIEEPFISVYIPSDYTTYWLDMPTDNESLKNKGITIEQYKKLFEDSASVSGIIQSYLSSYEENGYVTKDSAMLEGHYWQSKTDGGQDGTLIWLKTQLRDETNKWDMLF